MTTDLVAGICAEHRLCSQPQYDGCYAHFPAPHCRADGMPLPCDVMRIATASASMDVKRLARALRRACPDTYRDDPTFADVIAEDIAAIYIALEADDD